MAKPIAPSSPKTQAMLAQALGLQQAGKADEAAGLFKKVLTREANNTVALYSLAGISQQRGDLASALRYVTQCLKTAPDFLMGLQARAIVLGQLGRLKEAAKDIDAILRLDGQHDWALRYQQQLSQAQATFGDEPPGLRSHDPEAIQRGLAAQGAGDDASAQAIFQALIQDHEDYVALYSLGFLANKQGRPQEAIDYFERAVRADPSQPDAHYALATVLQGQSLFEEALQSFDAAIALNPKLRGAYLNKCGLLHSMNRQKEAVECMNLALAQLPSDPGLLNNKGYLLTEFKLFPEAAEVFSDLLKIDRKYESALGLHAFARMHACDWTNYQANIDEIVEAIFAGEKACNPLALMAMTDNAKAHLACAKQFGEGRYGPSANPLWRGEVYRHRRKRVAFLSADFREHPVGYLLIGLIEELQHCGIETIGISFGIKDNSELYTRYKAAFTHYLDCSDKTSLEVAQAIRALEADVAIDLSGYTSGSRLDVLGHRPAPAQATYLGFPGGLGLPFVDYLIADGVTVPTETEACYAERVLKLPHCYLPRDIAVVPAAQQPSREAFGLPEKGLVFCSFNHDYKISPSVFDSWMRLLGRFPGSVLWLMKLHEAAQRNLAKEAQARGVDPRRLVFATRVPRIEDHLARYRLADVCLDTFPYNGHTTASDVLYMGRPLVGLGGQGFASRVSTSLLHDANQSEFACTNVEDYEAKAVAIAEATLAGRVGELIPNAQECGHVASSLEQAQAFADCIHEMQPANPVQGPAA